VKRQGVFSLTLSPLYWDLEVVVGLRYDILDASENFYGLGENFDHVARRNTMRHMYHRADGSCESGYNEAHFPIPILISTKGSGFFVEDRHPVVFDVGLSDAEAVDVRFSTGTPLTFNLLVAATPLEVVPLYLDLTGKPALPPDWVFGVI